VYNETEFPNLHLFFTLPNTFRYAVMQKKRRVCEIVFWTTGILSRSWQARAAETINK
jgi:hypothetical protein